MKYFGTDGIRGLNSLFTHQFLNKIAYATARSKERPKIMVARDTRVSGREIEDILTTIMISEYGASVISCGMTPTPVLAYLTREYECDYGIMISASHNPPEYNGIKFFGRDGGKISLDLEKELEQYMDSFSPVIPTQKGTIQHIDGDEKYIDYLFSCLSPPKINAKILLDTANGATANIAPKLFKRLGAKVCAINTETCGKRINEGCGAVHTENFKNIMDKGGYDIGFTYDGDGDRVMAVKGGKILDGDHIMYVAARYLQEKGKLPKSGVVGTVMTNLGAEKAFFRQGIKFVRAAVGDKYVAAVMNEKGYALGGEASGHLIFKDYQNTGDGLLSSLMLTLIDNEKDILTLDDIVEYPQLSRDIMTTPSKVEIFKQNASAIDNYIAEISKGFEGRLVVRASGTEPRIRIMTEGKSKEEAIRYAEKIREFILGRIND